MPRITLRHFRDSRGPTAVGICKDNFKVLADTVNTAQRRLLYAREAGDEGWWGTWSEVAFSNVSRTNPYITAPREIARIEKLNVCDCPMRIQNQFYEYLDFGNGRLPKRCGTNWLTLSRQAYTRNTVPTFVDQTVTPCIIRVYPTMAADTDSVKRIFLQGVDNNGTTITSQDNGVTVQGEFVTLASPFVDFLNQPSTITGFQKDWTYGDVQIFQVDPATGDETLLLVMEPSETVAGYRRYYLHNLPQNCLVTTGSTDTLRVTAICKMELIPVVADTDYLLIQNLEAVIEECIAVRMSEMDNAQAQQLAAVHHRNAIGLLNGELRHYLGNEVPAVNFKPFGSARLERLRVDMI